MLMLTGGRAAVVCVCLCYSIFSGPGAMAVPPLKAATTLPWLTMPPPLRTTFA